MTRSDDAPSSCDGDGRVPVGDRQRSARMPRPADLSIHDIRALIETCDHAELPTLARRLARDPRAGVRDLAHGVASRLERERAELQRLDALAEMERVLHDRGLRVVAGVDEVGRGALAGPVTTCAVVLADDLRVPLLDDSKKLARPVRERVAAFVREHAVAFCVAEAGADEIDRLGIAGATRLAWQRALAGLGVSVDHVLVDGNDARIEAPATAVIGGDAKVACIAAASVVAKVHRDALMQRLALRYPGYGLEINRGYGTAEHLRAIGELGPSAIHRRSFAPCADQERLF